MIVKVKGFEDIVAEIEPLIKTQNGFVVVKFSGYSLLNGKIPPYYKTVNIEDVEEVTP